MSTVQWPLRGQLKPGLVTGHRWKASSLNPSHPQVSGLYGMASAWYDDGLGKMTARRKRPHSTQPVKGQVAPMGQLQPGMTGH